MKILFQTKMAQTCEKSVNVDVTSSSSIMQEFQVPEDNKQAKDGKAECSVAASAMPTSSSNQADSGYNISQAVELHYQ